MLKKRTLQPYVQPPVLDLLDGKTDDELLALRAEIDKRLMLEIKHVNLTEELGLQFRQGKALLEQVRTDTATPTNQKAQVFNSVNSMLNNIAKQMDIVYSAERLKRFEVAFLKILEKLPAESKEQFFEMYGEYLKDRGV